MERKPETFLIGVEMKDGSCAVCQMVTVERPQIIADGTVSKGWEVEPTPENVEAYLSKTFGDTWSTWAALADEDYFDRDRTFRKAWRLGKGRLTVDMPKARDVWRDELRRQRGPLLADLDTDYMRADETGNKAEKTRIAARKKQLRDVTADPRIEEAVTPEDLQKITL